MNNIPSHGLNDHRYADLLQDARTLGGESAAGGDALPKLALKLLRAANDGYITTEKSGPDKQDDAFRLYEAYAEAEGSKAIHNMTANGKKANVSKLRQIIIMGGMTTCDPVGVMDRAVTLRADMIKAEQKVYSAYPAYVNIARAQIEVGNSTNPRDINDDEIKAAMLKPELAEKSVVKQVERAKKILDDLIAGEKGVKCQDEQVIAAHEALDTWLNTFCTNKKIEEAKQVLAAAYSDAAQQLAA